MEASPRVHAEISFEQADDSRAVEEETDDELKIGEWISVGEMEALNYGCAINVSSCYFSDTISPLTSGNTKGVIL